MAVFVEIGGRNAARGLESVLGSPDLLEGPVPLIAKNSIGLVGLIGFKAAHVEVEEAVAIEIAPAGPNADFHWPRRKLHLLEFLALDVAIERAAFVAEQVEIAVVVEVAPDGRPTHPAHF